ncbi:hypothetical protein ACHAXT_003496 [Thalassiosira profunda]
MTGEASSGGDILRRRGQQSLEAAAASDPMGGSGGPSGGKVFYASSYAPTPNQMPQTPQNDSTRRIAAVFLLFAIASLVKLNRQSVPLGSLPALNQTNSAWHTSEKEPPKKLPPGHFVWEEGEMWSGNRDSLFSPDPAPVEEGAGNAHNEGTAVTDPKRFCGECRWNQWGNPITCAARLGHLTDKYGLSVGDARKSVMEKAECVRKESPTEGVATEGGQIKRRVEESATGEEPAHAHGWNRMLFGIFSQDSPNEHAVRMVNRETHLRYYKYHSAPTGEIRPDYICSLHDLLHKPELAKDAENCRVVYTFVMGGGEGDANLRNKITYLGKARDAQPEGTRCLWEDPECGGTDISKWTLDEPKGDISDVFASERLNYDDITLLSIPENHEMGKTDTWFTYASMLTRERPNLRIGFVGKMDSDNFIRWPAFFNYLAVQVYAKPYIYGGYIIHKKVCSGRVYGYACKSPTVIFDTFATGAHVYLSTPLAQHVFLNGTTLERKKEVWTVGEDMQLGNMVYSDPKIDLQLFNHRYGGEGINTHCFNDAERCRKGYYSVWPGLESAGEEWRKEQAKKASDR